MDALLKIKHLHLILEDKTWKTSSLVEEPATENEIVQLVSIQSVSIIVYGVNNQFKYCVWIQLDLIIREKLTLNNNYLLFPGVLDT